MRNFSKARPRDFECRERQASNVRTQALSSTPPTPSRLSGSSARHFSTQKVARSHVIRLHELLHFHKQKEPSRKLPPPQYEFRAWIRQLHGFPFAPSYPCLRVRQSRHSNMSGTGVSLSLFNFPSKHRPFRRLSQLEPLALLVAVLRRNLLVELDVVNTRGIGTEACSSITERTNERKLRLVLRRLVGRSIQYDSPM